MSKNVSPKPRRWGTWGTEAEPEPRGLNLSAEISRALGIDGLLCVFLFLMGHVKIGFGESREPIPSRPQLFPSSSNSIRSTTFFLVCANWNPPFQCIFHEMKFPEVPSCSQKSSDPAPVEPATSAPSSVPNGPGDAMGGVHLLEELAQRCAVRRGAPRRTT